MRKAGWMLPLGLAGMVIAVALGFVQYYNGYEEPGEHWAPAAPVAHESARFFTDMGSAGDYIVRIEKLRSKFPLLFVEYQTPGTVLEETVHTDDGFIRLSEQFADEGDYRITVQHTIHPMHKEVIDFTVQTPLFKYANDAVLFALLFLAGWLSGARLRALMMVCMLAMAGLSFAPGSAWAHGAGGEHQSSPLGPELDGVRLTWLAGHAPTGEANRAPMDWSMVITKDNRPVRRASYALDFVHLESGMPVLHTEGVTTNGGVIRLKYSPPDGTDYRLVVRADVDGRVYHLALTGAAEAIRPTAGRQWASFLLMMIPALGGMVWGWRRAGGA